LDHVVYTLVDGLTTDPRVLRKIDFPIYAREDWFIRSPSFRSLHELLPSDQFAEILSSQPYKRHPAAPETDWLWVLHELDNIDKHRTFLVVDPRLMIKTRQADGTVSVVERHLSEDLPTALTVSPAQGATSLEERAIVVVLSETGLRCDNITARQVWRDVVSEVKGIISRFERFFPSSVLGPEARSREPEAFSVRRERL
jgi:hypothetical protein